MQRVEKNQEEGQMSEPHTENKITPVDGQNSTNRTADNNNGEEAHCRQVLDELYKHIASENNPTKLQKVLLSSSYPSPISLKLQYIQEMLKDNKGCMDTDSINFAIRKLRREETIDRSPTDSENMIRKYYFSTDFARLACEEDGLFDLETCVRNDFVYHHHHNAFGQDADLTGHHCEKEVLCIPVVHHGCWSLYAFNISDKKLSIFDPAHDRAFDMSYKKLNTLNHTSETESGVGRLLVATPEHENSRLKICKALEFVKDNFNLLKNASSKFSSWRFEFTDLVQFRETSSQPATPLRICSDEDSGFFVFNFMRRWDGQQFITPEEIPKEPKELRKGFLEYIVSFNCNEVYELDDLPDVFSPMEKLKRCAQKDSGRPAWTRCKMDNGLLKAVRENNADKFAGLFHVSPQKFPEDYPKRKMLLQNLRRGATCDGDGVLHIAARYGNLELLHAIFKKVDVVLSLEALKKQLLEGSTTNKQEDACVQVLPTTHVVELIELQELLRSRNHKGETCLHEAVRHDDELFALSLILAHEKVMKDVFIKTNGQPPNAGEIRLEDVIKTNGPHLVQIVDYEGVSPLYLATTLCRSKIVKIILMYDRQLVNQGAIPAPDNQSLSRCWPGRQQIPASGVESQTSRQPAWLRRLFAVSNNQTGPNERTGIVASFSGPGGKTAMHAAVVLNEDLTKQVLDWMIEHVKVPDLTVMSDSSGNTPLHLVSSSVLKGGEAIAKLLLSVTTEVASGSGTVGKPTRAALVKDSKGWLPIHVAAANGNLSVIKLLIDKCPECIESRNARGQSFLHVAVQKKRRNVVQYVCSQQSLAGILNLTDQDGNTALHLAVESGNQRVFRNLMGNPRVFLSSANRKGWTPLDVALLSKGSEIRIRMSSRRQIYNQLKSSGAHYGTCRRDALFDEIEAKLDKEKLSETITKSAGLFAVCAIFMLNMSVTTFFNVAKQHLDPNNPAAHPGAANRVFAFKCLMVADAITFTSSLLAAVCSTLAGFSIMDRPARFRCLNIAGRCVQTSGVGLVVIFILAAYLALYPVDPHIAIFACVLPIVVVLIPISVTALTVMFLNGWTLLSRRFRQAPKYHRYFTLLLTVVAALAAAFFMYILTTESFIVLSPHHFPFMWSRRSVVF